MTETEAVQGAAERHEFRGFVESTETLLLPECWCGWVGNMYYSKDSARKAHERHQDRELGRQGVALSFRPRLHP